MAQLFHFPARARTHRVLPEIRVKFAAPHIDAVRRLLDQSRFEDCYLERLPNRRMAVDHTGNMMVIFPSVSLAAALVAELGAESIPSVAQYWVEQTGK